ncbi:MAG: hypothetical protein KAS21_09265 [Candidatus Aminicenantes bacterium]|nr:hypothetical protein [Candidatus Aminicenantes bacterium]
MNILKIIGRGFNLRSIKLAAYAWFYNMFLSSIIYFGFYMVFVISAGKSMIAEKIGMYGLFTALLDIFNNFPGSFTLLVSICFYFGILYVITSVFISAGIFSVMIEEEKATFFTLLSASIDNFFRFLKVFLINVINFALALIPMAFLVFVFWMTLERSLNETLFGIFIVIFFIIAMILLVFSVAIYDYSRIIRLKDGRNFFFSFREGVRFVFKNKKNILLLFLFYFISTGVLYIIFKLFMSVAEDFLGMIIVFILYQVVILIRYFLKIIIINGEFELIRVPYSEIQ